MLAPPGYVARTGILWTARSKSSRAMVAASGALGGRVMEGYLTAAETVISFPFLWGMERTPHNGQAA